MYVQALKAKLQAKVIAWDPLYKKKEKTKPLSEEGRAPKGGTKRNRSDSSTPSPSGECGTKKPRQEQMEVTEGESSSTQPSTSYKEVLTIIKMAIVTENFPTSKITEEQSDAIQVGEFKLLEGGEYPQFANFYTEKGAFILSCANQKTKEWLNTILPKLQPWQVAKLKVEERKDILRTTRFAV
jgi:hypothetical protein